MHLFLFSMIAICIGGSRSQEIAISTEYLRAHFNDSLSSESAINAQIQDIPPPIEPGAAEHILPAVSSTSTISTTTDDDSAEKDDDKAKATAYDHEHKTHHEHPATISIDVHNILDIFKQQLHASEKRILDAIKNHDHTNSAPAVAAQSYRTADR